MSDYQRVPVFKGATRLPTMLGVPRGVLLGTFMVCATLFMFIHAYALVIFALLVLIEHVIARNDDRMFHILHLLLITKVKNRVEASGFWPRWKGSSRSPIVFKRITVKGLPIMPMARWKYNRVVKYQEKIGKGG